MAGDLDLSATEEPKDPDFIIHTEPLASPPHDEQPAMLDAGEADPGPPEEPSPAADLFVAREGWLPLSTETMEKSDFPIKSEPFNPDKEMHFARLDLAKWLFRLLTCVIIGGTGLVIVADLTQRDAQQAKDLFLNIFTAVLAMVSSMVGYYYGIAGAATRRTDQRNRMRSCLPLRSMISALSSCASTAVRMKS